MKLIDNASKWYLMHSQRAIVLIGSIQATILSLPESVKQMPLPFIKHSLVDVLTALTVLAAVMGFVLRLVQQESVSG